MAGATRRDKTLRMVLDLIIYGWPKCKPDTPEVRSFFDEQLDLTVLHVSIVRVLPAIVSAELHDRVVQVPHESHCGIVKAKQQCGDAVWWPEINKEFRYIIIDSEPCVVAGNGGPSTIKPPIQPMRFPNRP